jgi:hypothetical protein
MTRNRKRDRTFLCSFGDLCEPQASRAAEEDEAASSPDSPIPPSLEAGPPLDTDAGREANGSPPVIHY